MKRSKEGKRGGFGDPHTRQCSGQRGGTIENDDSMYTAVVDEQLNVRLTSERRIAFFDLCRLARHKNQAGLYGNDFGSRWLARKLAYKNPQKDLTDPQNWYLPMK